MVSLNSPYKFLANDWKKTMEFYFKALVIGLIPIVGQLWIAGLTIRLISNAIKKENKFPVISGNVGSDMTKGLQLCLFGLIIAIPFIILMGTLFASMIGGIVSRANPSTDFISMIGGVSTTAIILFILLAIIYALIAPALIANFAKEGKFSALFAFKTAFKAVFGKFGEYLKMIGIGIVYGIAIGFISWILTSLLSFLPDTESVSMLISTIISPISLIISTRIHGEWFGEVSK